MEVIKRLTLFLTSEYWAKAEMIINVRLGNKPETSLISSFLSLPISSPGIISFTGNHSSIKNSSIFVLLW